MTWTEHDTYGWDKRAWPTDKQRPGESITAWCRRLDAQEDARAGVKRDA